MDRVEYQSLVIQDLINLEKQEELDLNPWYQRRSVWNPGQKSYLINTIVEKKPIPAIYIRHSLDLEKNKSIKEVVDGQQRCRTIIGYYKNDFSTYHPNHEKKVKFSDLGRSEQQEFLLTSLSVGYLLGATDADVVEIFARINSISKTLNAQEKRNAAYSGEMKQFCLKQATTRLPLWRDLGIFSPNDIARMNEVLFISDLTYNLENGLSDFASSKLDKFYEENDEKYPNITKTKRRLEKLFDRVGKLDPRSISDTIFKRQPLFFSFLICLDKAKNFNSKKTEESLFKIDAIYNSEDNSIKNQKFRDACKASTQRITQRKIRDEFISSYII